MTTGTRAAELGMLPGIFDNNYTHVVLETVLFIQATR